MCAIYTGTSGWAYPSWKPDFYPKEVRTKDFLAYYASQLNSVEVNFTFRSLLKSSTAESWLVTTPPDFLFTFKMHQAITHFRRLRNVEPNIKSFFASLEPFWTAKKIGAILIQLPHNMKADAPLLNDFLATLPPGAQYAVEFRNPTWLDDNIYNVLKDNNTAICVTEGEAELTTPDIVTADFSYYRFRRESYPRRRINELAHQFTSTSISPIYTYFKHEETPEGALNAVKLRRALASSLDQKTA
ncbi:MAG: hypothetical protein JWO13_1029 [Acidobacteriales bacterium]|nr:hypothetical protein [Terriglobales bacterium]